MDGKKSKFVSGTFSGDTEYFAVNRDRFTKEEAVQMCINDTGFKPYVPYKAEVWFGYGVDDDGEPHNGWWLDFGAGESPRRCPVWVMRISDVEVCL